jgi:hypothetical protein
MLCIWACFGAADGRNLEDESKRALWSGIVSGPERESDWTWAVRSEPVLLTNVVDARRHPRFKLQVEVCVYPRNTSVVRGHTVDISESGVSAMLRVEVPIGEVVRLEFALPLGGVEVHALVRQRSAFRYGLQFVDSNTAQEVIGRTCRQLAMEESLRAAKTP